MGTETAGQSLSALTHRSSQRDQLESPEVIKATGNLHQQYNLENYLLKQQLLLG